MGSQVNPEWWSSGVWNGRPIGEFLQRRDVTVVFRFLHARGVSYGRIAALVGISSNRAAEIAKGVRQVTAYEVLERIAVGLSIPRPAMGLGRDAGTRVGGDSDAVAADSGADSPLASGDASVEVSGLARLRLGLDEALALTSVAPRRLELIEESASEHMTLYPSALPQVMLSLLAADCREVQMLSLRRQPAAVQARISGVAALLATMCADALMRLGDAAEARRWYGTAIHAADDSGEAHFRVLVRAQAAMLPYYFGDPTQTVASADAALGSHRSHRHPLPWQPQDGRVHWPESVLRSRQSRQLTRRVGCSIRLATRTATWPSGSGEAAVVLPLRRLHLAG